MAGKRVYFRKSRERPNSTTALVITYLKSTLSQNLKDRETLWQFFQLLSFIHNLKDSQKVKKILSHQVYYDITFQLQEFVEFISVKKNNINSKRQRIF